MFLTFLRVWLGSIHFERITRYASSGGGGSTTERGFAYYQWIRAQSASPPLSLAGSGSDRSACLATSQRRAFKTRGDPGTSETVRGHRRKRPNSRFLRSKQNSHP